LKHSPYSIVECLSNPVFFKVWLEVLGPSPLAYQTQSRKNPIKQIWASDCLVDAA